MVTQFDCAEFRVRPRHLKLSHSDTKIAERMNALLSGLGKLIEQRFHSLAREQRLKGKPVEGFERLFSMAAENQLSARYPVGFVGKDQVTNYIERAERLRRNSAIQPLRGFSAQQSTQDDGRLR
jgi:hypothetical protein